MGRILVIGGYGAFGARVAERLARAPDLDIVVAGRSSQKAADFAKTLDHATRANVRSARIDAASATAGELRAIGPNIVINASGPFQDLGYGLARAAIAAGCHYVDLADARAFVTGISTLDAEAKAAGVAVISGASSVPAVSSAVVAAFAPQFRSLDAVEIGISPGNSFDPGPATTASLLGQVGKPHRLFCDGRAMTAYGWQGLRRHRFPGLGSRLMSNVEVPDLDLLPTHYPSLQTVRFVAGLEVAPLHVGVWALSWLVRAGIVRDLGALSPALLALKRRLRVLGSDRGAMFVTMRGQAHDGQQQKLAWHLIAGSGHGPYVPATPAVMLAKRLSAGGGPPPGARAAFGLIALGEFESEVADLDIACATRWCRP